MSQIQMLVFNANKWRAAGGDVGDNSQFWEVATILNTYPNNEDLELLAIVQWPDGSVSRGHFVSMMQEVPK